MEAQLIAGAVIIGIVNGIQLLSPQIKGFISFAISMALGIAFGLAGFYGLTLETGIITALASSGLYKLTQQVGGK